MKAYSIMNGRQQARETVTPQRSWLEAYRAFLLNPRELLNVKLLPLIVLGIVPLSMADDLLLPFLGVVDDIPTALIVAFAVIRTWQRVRKYR
jgi:hypothetical protein